LGDMLYLSAELGKPRRIQAAFVSEKEVKDVVRFLKQQAEEISEDTEETEENKKDFALDLDKDVTASLAEAEDVGDELYGDAKEVVAQAGKASASLLQRRLRVGYARAARLLDLLEERGLIGPGEGAKPREVFIGREAGIPDIGGELPPVEDDGAVAEVALSDGTDDSMDKSVNNKVEEE